MATMFWQRTLGVWLIGLGFACFLQSVQDWCVANRLVSGVDVYPRATRDDAIAHGLSFAEVTPEQFAQYAAIGQHLRRWEEYRGEGPFPGYVSPEVWNAFRDNVTGGQNQFAVSGTLYAAEQAEEIVSVQLDVPGLAIAVKIAAGLCLAVGVWYLMTPYRIAAAKKGVHVAGPGFALFGDTVNIVCTTVCAFVWIDALLFHGLGQPGGISVLNQWLFDDDLSTWDPVQCDAIYFAFAFGVLVTPALAALVTQRSGQAVRATADGVTSDGGFGTHSIPWAEVEDVLIENDDIPSFRPGLRATRRLQKKLVLRGPDGELVINEPALADTKRQIVRMLVEKAPEPLAGKIREVGGSW